MDTPKYQVGDKVKITDTHVELTIPNGTVQIISSVDDRLYGIKKPGSDYEFSFYSTQFEPYTEESQQMTAAEYIKTIDATVPDEPKSALDVQIGGSHYKGMAIQPMEYSMKNGLDACQHTAIKYITRFREKGGIQDLEKAKHCIDLLIQFEENK
jgi:hypothetical protein